MDQKRFVFRLQLPSAVLIVLIFISGLLLGLSSGGFIIDFKKTGFTVFSTMQKGIYVLINTVSDTFTSINQLRNLRREYENLSTKLQDYEQIKFNLSEIIAENERLLSLLNISESYKKRNIPAYIIGRDPNNTYSAITINKGVQHGIKKNMPVIAYQNDYIGLVGKIIEVGQYSSMFMPIYDFQYNVSARIQKTRDIGLVSGLGSADGNISLKYIKKRVLTQLQDGDIVVTSGENESYERDIPIGKIVKVILHDYDSSLEIELEPIIDFSRLDTVIVVDLFNPKEAEK